MRLSSKWHFTFTKKAKLLSTKKIPCTRISFFMSSLLKSGTDLYQHVSNFYICLFKLVTDNDGCSLCNLPCKHPGNWYQSLYFWCIARYVNFIKKLTSKSFESALFKGNMAESSRTIGWLYGLFMNPYGPNCRNVLKHQIISQFKMIKFINYYS